MLTTVLYSLCQSMYLLHHRNDSSHCNENIKFEFNDKSLEMKNHSKLSQIL